MPVKLNYQPIAKKFILEILIFIHFFADVCESCNHQLLAQWEVYQKAGKPVADRFYQLIKPAKPPPPSSFAHLSEVSASASLTSATTSQHHHQHRLLHRANSSSSILPVTPSSSSASISVPIASGAAHHHHLSSSCSTAQQVSGAITRSLFTCVICGIDLLYATASKMASNSSSEYQPPPNSHLAFSMLTEPIKDSQQKQRTLLLNSAMEFSLLPFMPNAAGLSATSASLQPQLAALLESGRVLVCFGCFEGVASRSSLPLNHNNSTALLGTSGANRSSHQRDSVNGKLVFEYFSLNCISTLNFFSAGNHIGHLSRGSSHNESSAEEVLAASLAAAASAAPDETCHACGINKAHRWVETKETASKEAFFPFLRNPSDPEGRTHLCGACHLILETQWDAYEAILAPQSQRDYQFPQNHPFNAHHHHHQNPNSSIRPSSSNSASSSSNGHHPLPPPSAHSSSSGSSTHYLHQLLHNQLQPNHHHHPQQHIQHQHHHQNPNLLLRRPSSHSTSSDRSSPLMSAVNHHQHLLQSSRQSTPPPLKIQINSPNVVGRTTPQQQDAPGSQLLLTTVSHSNEQSSSQGEPVSLPPPLPRALPSSSSSVVDNELIFTTINEFMAKLGGPHSHISGCCVICNEYNKAGEGYQIFSSAQKVIISPELGQLPFFPMLKQLRSAGSTKRLKADHTHVTCVYCYHSLIAQWAAYHVSAFPEDRDPSTRIYNCRDFICFVCGVTTYRSLVRSIAVKDFPFLLDHRRPPGKCALPFPVSLSLTRIKRKFVSRFSESSPRRTSDHLSKLL